jgi:hypothetical protein
MPRFFFHVTDMCQDLSLDGVGLEFPDTVTVCLATLCAAHDIGAELAACGLSLQDYTILVMNAAGELVFELPFSETLDHEVHPLPRRFLQ